ncbi:MAG TPA: 7-cyano-7-deazaguanine synthase QueC [Candidatus Margulisiibacteriota bacterium]|nr:7-cyano-7-deazaguanine synthase QueC [Candidatus Margulisiibacteriota bacterium]
MKSKFKGLAVVLLSGGLDSATALYLARSRGLKCFCLIFDYGQRHKREIESAKRIAKAAGCNFKVIKLHFPWKGSSLLDKLEKISLVVESSAGKIPATYVPGRNIIFLSIAFSCAEAMGADAVYIGAHAQDYSGYPDCRPQFYRALKKVIETGTKAGVEKRGIKVETPLIDKGKGEIIRMALELGVPLELTWSCYKGGKIPCASCDSCHYRAKGFKEAGIKDPLMKNGKGKDRGGF